MIVEQVISFDYDCCPHASWTVAESRERGVFIQQFKLQPSEFVWEGEKVTFKEAWLEDAVEVDYDWFCRPYQKKIGWFICFRLDRYIDSSLADLEFDDINRSFGRSVSGDLVVFRERFRLERAQPTVIKIRIKNSKDQAIEVISGSVEE
jgi:hypothetical protein